MITNFFNKLITTEFFFNFIIFISTFLKLYRIIYYLRIMLEVLPLYNGYKWPVSVIYFLIRPITYFYETCLPQVQLNFSFFLIDPTIILTVEIFAVLIEFIDDIKDAYVETVFA